MPNLKNKSINEGLALALKAQAEASSYQMSLPEISHIRADRTSTVFKVNNTEIFNFLNQPLSCRSFSLNRKPNLPKNLNARSYCQNQNIYKTIATKAKQTFAVIISMSSAA